MTEEAAVVASESVEESEGGEAQADAEEFARQAATFNSIFGLLTESVGRAKQRFLRLSDFANESNGEAKDRHSNVLL